MRIEIIQNMSHVYRKNVKHDKNKKLVHFFFRVEASRVNEIFKNIRLSDNDHLLKRSSDNNVKFGL